MPLCDVDVGLGDAANLHSASAVACRHVVFGRGEGKLNNGISTGGNAERSAIVLVNKLNDRSSTTATTASTTADDFHRVGHNLAVGCQVKQIVFVVQAVNSLGINIMFKLFFHSLNVIAERTDSITRCVINRAVIPDADIDYLRRDV